GSFSWNLDAQVLNPRTAGVTTSANYLANTFSGGWGGPLIRNKLLYNVSFRYLRRADGAYALSPDNAGWLEQLGVAQDSVARFIAILQNRYNVASLGQTGAYDRTTNGLSSITRVDWTVQPGHQLRFTLNTNNSDFAKQSIGLL